MILVHHLRVGRSIFTVWLLEELGLDYTLKFYDRDENNRAPANLRGVHPLGKSPVIEVDGTVMAESGAITAYLTQYHDPEGLLSPPVTDQAARAKWLQWLHYSEGSAFVPLIMQLLFMRAPDSNAPMVKGFADGETALHLGFINDTLAGNDFILGDHIQAPDFGLGFIVQLASRVSLLGDYPKLEAYLERLTTRPAFLRAMEKTGG